MVNLAENTVIVVFAISKYVIEVLLEITLPVWHFEKISNLD